jgi:hypothetical protein
MNKFNPLPTQDLPTVYVLSNSENSKRGPIRQDTVGTRNPKYLNSSKLYALSMTSRRYLGEGKGYVATQYIPGADTIYVNDYTDTDGKVRQGLKSQGYNMDLGREQATKMNIGFEFGVMDLKKFGGEPALLEFVATHESNSESESGKNGMKNPSVVKLHRFKPLKKEENAKTRSANFEDDMAGFEIVKGLRSPNKGGGYDYNENKLNAIYNILGLTQQISASEPNQRFEMILRVCQQGASQFAELVTDGIKDTEILLGKAIASQVVVLTSAGAGMIKEGIPVEFAKFPKGTKEEGRITALAYMLLGDPELKAAFGTIQAETEQRLAAA